MKKKALSSLIVSVLFVALTIGNILIFSSCLSTVKEYADEKMLEIFQTIRINRYQKMFNDEKIAKEQTDLLISAISNNNKEAFKSLFSQKALTDCDNADEQIDKLLERFGGKIISWDYYGLAGEGNIEYGTIKQYKISSQAFFECNEGIFRVHMFIYPIDVENPENIGIYNICLVEKEVDFDMLKGYRETIKDDEMEKHPIIWVLDIAELGERTSNETTWYSDKYIYPFE